MVSPNLLVGIYPKGTRSGTILLQHRPTETRPSLPATGNKELSQTRWFFREAKHGADQRGCRSLTPTGRRLQDELGRTGAVLSP